MNLCNGHTGRYDKFKLELHFRDQLFKGGFIVCLKGPHSKSFSYWPILLFPVNSVE